MNKLIYTAFIFILFNSCGKGPETVTVTSNPLQPVEFEGDTTSSDVENNQFQLLTIAETGTIESLDPLFAENNSELRVINLIYDGLVTLDESGNMAPSLAVRWDVNTDSTRYTFHLRPKVRFHNSPVFSGGIGRNFTAEDVRYVFERMASVTVPSTTVDRFSEIRGMNEFHHEQTFVKNPAKRVLNTISGIVTPNDSTVIFNLEEPSSDFLEKLAHPSASIYPRESAVNIQPPIQVSAGTGAFYFIKKEENRHILAVYRDYYAKRPMLNRLDIISGISEKEIFQQFARDELDVILEPSPALITTIADSAGNLSKSYSNNFNLENTGLYNSYRFFYNPASDHTNIVEITNELDVASFRDIKGVDSLKFHSLEVEPAPQDTSTRVVFAQTNHPAERFVINHFAQHAGEHGFRVVLSPSYSISNSVTFSTKSFPGSVPFLSWKVPVYYLTQLGISGIELNQKPWNLSLSTIQFEGEQ